MTLVRGLMRRIIVTIALALACTVNAETITGQVVGVADDDTITVLDADKVQHKIRLAGIDAPEKKQAFGKPCQNHNKSNTLRICGIFGGTLKIRLMET